MDGWPHVTGNAGVAAPPPTSVLSDDRAMVLDHTKWTIGPPQWGIGLKGVSVLLTDFYAVCRGCGVLRLSDLPDSINSFKNRLDKHWTNQEVVSNFNSELTGTGGLPVCM